MDNLDETQLKTYRTQIAKYAELCNRPLNRSFIKSRKGDKGGSVDYIEAAYIIRCLNTVFPLGWSTDTNGYNIVSRDKTPRGQTIVYATCEMKLLIHPDGVPLCSRMNIGVGKSFATDAGNAESSAIKNAYTDAVKRCGMEIGDFFGLALKMDSGMARDIGAIDEGSAASVFRERELKSNRFPWLSSTVYEQLVDAHYKSQNEDNFLVPVDLRNTVLEEATSMHEKLFFASGGRELCLKFLSDAGVAHGGRALPSVRQIQDFLTRFTGLIRGEEENAVAQPEDYSGNFVVTDVRDAKNSEKDVCLFMNLPEIESEAELILRKTNLNSFIRRTFGKDAEIVGRHGSAEFQRDGSKYRLVKLHELHTEPADMQIA